MARVICKCGQQFRTSAKPGTQVQCPRCANAVSVTEKVFDLQDRIRGPHSLAVNPESDRFGEVTSAENLQNRRGTNRSRLWLAIGFATVGLAAAMILAIAFWKGGNGQPLDLTKKQPNQKNATGQVEPSEPKDFRWSSVAKWDKDFPKDPKGQQIRSYSEQIAQVGQSMDPLRFWQKLNTDTFKNRVFSPEGSLRAYQDKLSIEQIFDRLQGIPIDAVSNPLNTTGSNWKVIGIHQGPYALGVLVRYFHDPLELVDLVQSDPWIDSLRQMISFDEYANVARDLFASSPSDRPSRPDKAELNPDDGTVSQTIFTPMFGYMVLLFNVEQDRVIWSDAVSIPGDVQLSRASGSIGERDFMAFMNKVRVSERKVPEGWRPEGIIDVFGEYESQSEEPLAEELVFSPRRPDAATTLRIDRSLEQIRSGRSKSLIQIAQCVTSNYGQLKEKTRQFREAFPDDSGLDALLLSMWLRHYHSVRAGLNFDEFGVVFADAAERLYIKTQDPALFDIQSRIYWSNSRKEEARKSLDLAEKSGSLSAFYFQRKIEESIDQTDKPSVLKYLSQFNSFWLSQPGVVIGGPVDPRINRMMRRWSQDPSGKPKE